MSEHRLADTEQWGDDLVLAGEAAAGVEGAWDAIVRRYGGIVYALITRWGYRDERDDLSQEIFLLVWRRLDRFRGESSLKTWIYQITINHLKNHSARRVPRRKREQREADLGEDDRSIVEQAPAADDPALALEHKSRIATVRNALEQLPERYREILILKELEDLDYAEIADILKLPLGTVKSRISRARQALGELLKGFGGLL